jgi:serine protease Do
VITKIDEVAVEDPESLSEAIHKYKPEDKVTVTFKRDGKEQKVTAALGKMKSQSYNYGYTVPNGQNFNFKGMTPPGAFSWDTRRQPRLGIKAQDTEDGKGVKVLDVDDESAAEKAGIKEGDVITRFDGKAVNSAADLAEGARAGKDKSSFKVNLLRDGKPQEVEVKIPKKLKTADL